MPKKKRPDNKVLRCLELYNIFNKDEIQIIKYMSHESKNVFNFTMYCINIYYKFKDSIFRQLLDGLNNKTIVGKKQFEVNLYHLLKQYFQHYSDNKNIFIDSNNFVYNIISTELNNVFVDNDNYYDLLHNFEDILDDIPDLMIPNECHLIMKRILDSYYIRNYNYVKKCLLNHIPIDKKVPKKFIKDVKNELFVPVPADSNHFKELIKEGNFFKKIISDQNIIARFIYKKYSGLNMLPSDVITNIVAKGFQTHKSHMAKKAKGMKSDKAKFLPFDGNYILPYFVRSFKEIQINNQSLIRLTVGKYVARNLVKITGNEEYIKLNPTDYEGEYIQYALKEHMSVVPTDKKLDKNNYIVDNKYIPKDSDKIKDAYYIFITKPKKLNDLKIKLIEICPMYNGNDFKLCITYEKPFEIKHKAENAIAMDLGQKNPVTIYDPNGEQKILNGNYLNSLNEYYNYKIGLLQSTLDKIKKKSELKNNLRRAIQRKYMERHHRINDYFNQVVAWIAKKYSNKSRIIIGYNQGWKQEVKMGTKNNRRFCQIPYMKLLNKLKSRMQIENCSVDTTEEAYTSICDALALEEVKVHDQYSGKRMGRLFKSGTGKIIHSDLNGAINIMRKWRLKNGFDDMATITGKNICNPTKIDIKEFRHPGRMRFPKQERTFEVEISMSS